VIALEPRRLLLIVLVLATAGVAINYRVRHPAPEDLFCANPDRVLEPAVLDGLVAAEPNVNLFDEGRVGRMEGRVEAQNKGAIAWIEPPQWFWSRSYASWAYGFGPTTMEWPVFSSDEVTLETFDAQGTPLPVHVRVQQMPGSVIVTAYFYVHRGRPVESLFSANLSSLFEQLVEGQSSFMIVAIQGTAANRPRLARANALRWLGEAWERYAAVCGV